MIFISRAGKNHFYNCSCLPLKELFVYCESEHKK
jgi:hypothetical protein